MNLMKQVFLFLFIALSATAIAQNNNAEEAARKIADYIIANTSFQFIDSKTNEKFSTTKGLDTNYAVKAESKFNKWFYPNGVLSIGMVQLSGVLNDKKYADYAKRNYDFIFDNISYFEPLYKSGGKPEWNSFFAMDNLDACGAMAAGLADVDATSNRKDFNAYLERAANYISNFQLRLPDKTFVRPTPRNLTLWADDLYMSVPFLARMGKLTGNKKYFDDAVIQVENFNKYLYDPATGLFFHCYYYNEKQNGTAHWGRSNGWVAVAQVELLNNLPADHPKRQHLIDLLLRQIAGYARYQDVSGLWHQLLDKSDSYLETSVTAMFTYTVARAVNEGWIPKSYLSIARDGWEGLVSKINVDGQVRDVCTGTNAAENIRYYYTRPTPLNDTHGLGPILLAATEIIKANRNEKTGGK